MPPILSVHSWWSYHSHLPSLDRTAVVKKKEKKIILLASPLLGHNPSVKKESLTVTLGTIEKIVVSSANIQTLFDTTLFKSLINTKNKEVGPNILP